MSAERLGTTQLPHIGWQQSPESGDAPRPIHSKHARDEVLAPLIQEFIADLPAQLAELCSAASQEDLRETNLLSHRLKGDAATYGYPELAHVAHEMEEATEDPVHVDFARLAKLLAALQIIGRRVIAGLSPDAAFLFP